MDLVANTSDQADTLRKLARSKKVKETRSSSEAPAENRRPTKVISITSGKGGVGKSNVAVNLSLALAKLGKKVLIIDADLGLANIDVLLGVNPEFNLNDVFAGKKELGEIIIEGPGGIKILPAGSGVQEYTRLGQEERLMLLNELDLLDEDFDYVLIDTEAGISDNVAYFNVAAQEIVVVVSPEPLSITDAYALIKLLATRYAERYFKVLVNRAKDTDDALEVFKKLSYVTSRFLDISVDYLGCVLNDDKLLESVRQQRAVFELYPQADSSKCFGTVARRIAESPGSTRIKGNIQFFSRKLFASPL